MDCTANNYPAAASTVNRQDLSFYSDNCSTSTTQQEERSINNEETIVKQRKSRRSKYDVSHLFDEGVLNYKTHGVQNDDTLTLDPSLDLKGQKSRTVFNDEQTVILEAAYRKHGHPDQEQRFMVAQLCGLTEECVRIWYQNRRAREKRQQEDDLASALPILAKQKADRNNITDTNHTSIPTISNKIDQIFEPGQHNNVNKNKNEKPDGVNNIFATLLGNQNLTTLCSNKPTADADRNGQVQIQSEKMNTDCSKASLDGEKKTRKRRTKAECLSDNSKGKKKRKNVSEVDIIKSIMRGEDIKTESIDNTPPSQKSSQTGLTAEMNKYAKKLGNAQTGYNQGYNQAIVDNHVYNTDLKPTVKNEDVAKNYSRYPQNPFFQNQNSMYQPGLYHQQPWFGNMWAPQTPHTFDTMNGDMTLEQMRNMLVYQQNIIASYQKFLFSKQMYPWQLNNHFSSEREPPTNSFQQMLCNPLMPMYGNVNQYQDGKQSNIPPICHISSADNVPESTFPSVTSSENNSAKSSGNASSLEIDSHMQSVHVHKGNITTPSTQVTQQPNVIENHTHLPTYPRVTGEPISIYNNYYNQGNSIESNQERSPSSNMSDQNSPDSSSGLTENNLPQASSTEINSHEVNMSNNQTWNPNHPYGQANSNYSSPGKATDCTWNQNHLSDQPSIHDQTDSTLSYDQISYNQISSTQVGSNQVTTTTSGISSPKRGSVINQNTQEQVTNLPEGLQTNPQNSE